MKVPFFHICKYSKWSDPVDGYDGKRQWKTCCVCNKIKHRRIPYDGSTLIESIKEALKGVINENS